MWLTVCIVQLTEEYVAYSIHCTVYSGICGLEHTLYSLQMNNWLTAYIVQFTEEYVAYSIHCIVYSGICGLEHTLYSIY